MRQSPLRVRRLGFSQVEPLVVIAIIGTLVGLRSLAVVGVVLTAAVMRLVPHPPNVTPMFALALFGGAYFGSRIVSIVVPLAAMLLSNIVLGLTSGGNPFPFMPFVYISFVLTVLLGWWVRRRHCSVVATLSATLVSAVLFFAISNTLGFGWKETCIHERYPGWPSATWRRFHSSAIAWPGTPFSPQSCSAASALPSAIWRACENRCVHPSRAAANWPVNP